MAGIYTPFILNGEFINSDLTVPFVGLPRTLSDIESNKINDHSEKDDKDKISKSVNDADLEKSSDEESISIILPPEQHTPLVNQVLNTKFGHVFKKEGMNIGYMGALLEEASKYGIFFRVTSGVRKGAKTKQGKTSWHSLGHAIDVTPIPGETYADLKYKIKNSPEFVKWMQYHGYGIFDETLPEVMKKTGATGAHWHIGKDRVAKQGLLKIIS